MTVERVLKLIEWNQEGERRMMATDETMHTLQLSDVDMIYINDLLDNAIREQQVIEAETAKEIVEYADRPDENWFRVSVSQNRVAAKTREKLQDIQNRINEGETK